MTRIIIAVLLLLFSWQAQARHHMSGHRNGVLPVKTMVVQQQRVGQMIFSVGTIIAPEVTNISASVEGHIQSIAFQNGQTVAAGAVLLTLDHATEVANVQKAEAKLQSSHMAYQRDVQLLQKHMMSEQVVEAAKAQYLQDQADVDLVKAALAKKTIRAPFAGTVGEVKVSVGDYVTAGQALVRLVGSEALRVDYSIPEDKLALASLGDRVELRSASSPQQSIQAQLSFIAPDVDPKTHTVDCQATLLAGPATFLRAGMFVNVTQWTKVANRYLMVPEAAVVSYQGHTVVYIVKAGHAKAVVVQVGEHQNGKVQIKHGLQLGMTIIVSGQGEVTNDQAVSITTE